MASAPPRQTFTKKKIPFSHIEKVEPGNRSRSESMRSIGTEYSDAYPVEIENIDPKMEAMKATYLEEQRSLANKAHRQQNKTQKAKVVSKQEALAKQIANIIKPGARVVIARKAGTRKIKRRRTQKKKRV